MIKAKQAQQQPSVSPIIVEECQQEENKKQLPLDDVIETERHKINSTERSKHIFASYDTIEVPFQQTGREDRPLSSSPTNV